MSPVPDQSRLREYAVKGAHAGLRRVAAAPEHLAARRLRSPTDEGGSKVLFLTPRDWAAHVQWDFVMGDALRLRGAQVDVVGCGGGLEVCDRANTWESPPPPCASCRRYVRDAAAAHDHRYTELAPHWGPAEWPELDAVPAAELPSVEAEGLPLGRIVRIPVAWFLMGDRPDEDPLWPLTTRRFLRSARRVAIATRELLDRIRPDVIVMTNGLFLFERVMWELARQRDVDVVTYERGFITDTLLFRRDVPACLGDVSPLWPARAQRPLDATESRRLDDYFEDRRFGRRTIDRYWVAPRFEAPDRGKGKLVLAFSNLTWDSAAIGQGVAFPSLRDWVVACVRAMGRHPDHKLIFRIHPAEVRLPGKQTREPVGAILDSAFDVLPANVEVVDAMDQVSSYALMEAADLGLVFTSTTGLEMAARGIPVIVAGSTHYRGKGFTIDVDDPASFEAALAAQLDRPEPSDLELARRYAHLFFFEAPLRAPGVVEHIPGLARITASSLDDLRPGADADLDVICDGILRGGSFTRAAP